MEKHRSFISPNFVLFDGQTKSFDLCASAPPLDLERVLIVLPTGYGKSRVALGAFAILKARGLVDHLLVLCGVDSQRTQWVDESKADLTKLGVKWAGARSTKIANVTKKDYDLEQLKGGSTGVYVATYAQAYTDTDAGEFWARLTSMGRWMIVFDECHHLAEGSTWGVQSARIHCKHRLYMSATPVRWDRVKIEGLAIGPPDAAGKQVHVAAVEVTRQQAEDEGAIRKRYGVEHHYTVEVTDKNGVKYVLSTEELRKQGVTNLREYVAWETRKEIRYRDSFLDPILIDAINILEERNSQAPIYQHQMIVHAMSCKHAAHVAREINKRYGSGYADWAGTASTDKDGNHHGRPTRENRAVLERFKDRDNKLAPHGRTDYRRPRVLVHVSMAAEGFNNPRCSLGVFLHLVNSDLQLAQAIGRHTRKGPCHAAIFFSADSSVGDYLRGEGTEIVSLQVAVERERKPREPGTEREPGEVPRIVVDTVAHDRRLEIGEAPKEETFLDVRQKLRSQGLEHLFSTLTVDDLKKFRDMMSGKESVTTAPEVPPEREFRSERERRGFWVQQVRAAVNACAGAVVRFHYAPGKVVPKEDVAVICEAINSLWLRASNLRHSSMTADHLEQKHGWLERLTVEIEKRGVPESLVQTMTSIYMRPPKPKKNGEAKL